MSPRPGVLGGIYRKSGGRYAQSAELRHSGITGTPGPGARGPRLSRRVGVWSAVGFSPVTLKRYPRV